MDQEQEEIVHGGSETETKKGALASSSGNVRKHRHTISSAKKGGHYSSHIKRKKIVATLFSRIAELQQAKNTIYEVRRHKGSTDDKKER